MWDLIVSVPDHCLSFYFRYLKLHIHVLREITLSYNVTSESITK